MLIITAEDLPGFVESLKQHFPKSLQVYCQARNTLRKQCFWPGIEIVVDKYPDYSVCLTRPILGSEASLKDYVPRPKNYLQAVTLFTKSAEALRSLLNEDKIVDWYRHISFISIPSEMVPVVLERSELFGYSKGTEEREKNDVFIIRPEDLKETEATPLDSSYHVGTLDESHIPQIVGEWNFVGRVRDPEDAYPFFHYMLTHNFPNCAVFNEKDELAAYAMYLPDGNVCHGFFNEARIRGLFQTVIRLVAEKIFNELQQEMTWAHVRADNPASAVSFRKLGAKMDASWKTQELDYQVYTF